MAQNFGAFVISLDLESLWGVRDHASLTSSYGKNLRGERDAIYQMLDIFEEFAVSATWATVGFLFAKNRDELRQFYPQRLPEYTQQQLSPYAEEIGENEEQDPYHYGGALVERIARVPRQEIGSHTFSHYYCLEPGQTLGAFQQDLDAAVAIARAKDITLRSMVFPRNQVNPAYLPLLRTAGFTNYRGTEPTWYYRASRNQTASKRGVRLADSYLPLSGAQTVRAAEVSTPSGLANLRSSRFLRPFMPKLRHLDPLRLQRITQQMRHAACVNGVFHLWWHPHNFGCNTAENMAFLRKILSVHRELTQSHQWPSRSMAAATPGAEMVTS